MGARIALERNLMLPDAPRCVLLGALGANNLSFKVAR